MKIIKHIYIKLIYHVNIEISLPNAREGNDNQLFFWEGLAGGFATSQPLPSPT